MAGASYPINENVNIYSDVHVSAKNTGDGKTPTDYKAGIWVGIGYKFKHIPGLSAWLEPLQINAKLGEISPNESRTSFAGNGGVTWTIPHLK